MPRPSCLLCTLKHLGQATINYTEYKMGYPIYWVLVVGNMAEAEAESLLEYPDLAAGIRQERTNFMTNRNKYIPKLMDLIEWGNTLLDKKTKKR